MKGLNRAELIGYLGGDPTMRYAKNGDAVASFSIATSDSWTDQQTGEKREKTEWHRLVAFGKMAEIIGKYCKTGIRLWIEGKLETSKYTDAQGITRYSTQIIVNNLIFLGDNGKNNGQQRSQNASHSPPPQNGDYSNAYAVASGGTMAQRDAENGNQWDGGNFDDDIPF
jgi:single-stranded DNA-binding protein